MPAARPTAATRLRRLLAIIPWLATRTKAGTAPTVTEVCERFGITRRDLEADLELLLYVGVPPYTPDQLFEISIEGDHVLARLTPSLDRPLRLTPEEGLALVVAGAALTAVPGAETGGPLPRAIAKVARLLGIDPDEAVDVELGPAAEPTLALLRQAVAARQQVEIDYYAFGRDERTQRTVDPWHVVNEAGAWYLLGYDHLRGQRRSFRVDRMVSARQLAQP
ncbi:MAG: helix-turn-helix transcriptional regulator, partial [Acidimicrobiales bacterium]